MVKKEVHRFEIWLVQLDPTQDSEIKKKQGLVLLSLLMKCMRGRPRLLLP